MGEDRLDGLNASWVAWLEAMAGHVPGGESRHFGSIASTSIGVPMPLFNQAFVFDEPDPGDLDNAVAWLRSRGAPFWVTIPGHLEASLADAMSSRGLTPGPIRPPGMVLSSLDGLEQGAPDALVLEPLTTQDQLDIVVVATVDGFGAPPEGARHMSPVSMIDDPSMQWFVGTVGGEPAACGQLLLSDDCAGVYSIAVIEPFRRRGYGEAMTRAALLAGRDRGATFGALQASVMGRPVYEAMGFDTLTNYVQYGDDPGGS